MISATIRFSEDIVASSKPEPTFIADPETRNGKQAVDLYDAFLWTLNIK